MPNPDYTLKRHDTAGVVQATIVDAAGTAVALTGGTVIFKMSPIAGGDLIVAGTATIEEDGFGSVGHVHYTFTSSDSTALTTGWYAAEWELTLGGTVQTYPPRDPLLVNVTSDLPL